MGINETGWKDVDWIRLAQNRDKWKKILVKVAMNLWTPKNVGNLLSSRGSVYVLKKGFAACSYFYVLSR